MEMKISLVLSGEANLHIHIHNVVDEENLIQQLKTMASKNNASKDALLKAIQDAGSKSTQ